MKDTITGMNTLEETNSRVDKAKNQISDLEYKEAENTQSEKQKGDYQTTSGVPVFAS